MDLFSIFNSPRLVGLLADISSTMNCDLHPCVSYVYFAACIYYTVIPFNATETVVDVGAEKKEKSPCFGLCRPPLNKREVMGENSWRPPGLWWNDDGIDTVVDA
jgi:hypothetical protein